MPGTSRLVEKPGPRLNPGSSIDLRIQEANVLASPCPGTILGEGGDMDLYDE